MWRSILKDFGMGARFEIGAAKCSRGIILKFVKNAAILRMNKEC
jgi:hypothetical protein